MAWTTPRTWANPEVVTDTIMNTHVRDNFRAIGDAWTSYATTWGASTTNPTLGNGTLTMTYLLAGKLLIGRFELTIGSTTSVGSGIYTLTLPVSVASSTYGNLGSAHFADASAASAPYPGSIYRGGAANVLSLAFGNARWTNAAPVVPANGDVISGQFTCEAA